MAGCQDQHGARKLLQEFPEGVQQQLFFAFDRAAANHDGLSLRPLERGPESGDDGRGSGRRNVEFEISAHLNPVCRRADGKQASPVKNGDMETWVKPLADGGVAVGVVNLGPAAAQATVNAGDLHLSGKVKKARDVWADKDVKFTGGAYAATVPSHGVLLLRVSAK